MKYSPKRRVIKIWGLFIYIFNDACNTFLSLIIFTLEIFFEERNQWLTDWDQSKTDCISSRHLTTELSVTLEHLLTIIWGFLLLDCTHFPLRRNLLKCGRSGKKPSIELIPRNLVIYLILAKISVSAPFTLSMANQQTRTPVQNYIWDMVGSRASGRNHSSCKKTV